MSYSLIAGDLEPDMHLVASIDGEEQDLTGAQALVLRWKKPDGSVTEVDMLPGTLAALVVADDVIESVSTSLNTLTLTAHGLLTWDGPVRLTTTVTLPTGLALATDYWIIRVDANNIQLASSLGGSAVDITGAGSGTHTISDTATTMRADLSAGAVKRVWVAGDTDLTGLHLGQVVVTQSNGEDQTFPDDGSHFIWHVYEQLTADG